MENQFLVSSWLPQGRKDQWEVREDPTMPGCMQLVEWTEDSNPNLWMDDRPRELKSHLPILNQAFGRILVTGMGLMAVQVALARKSSVESVHTIEQNPHVVELIWPAIQTLPAEICGKLTYEIGDADAWKPGQEERPYDFGYFDHTIFPMNEEKQSEIRDHYKICREHLFWQYTL